jgi:hypothetical protein
VGLVADPGDFHAARPQPDHGEHEVAPEPG